MSFRDQATADLSTFLNVDEFADAVEIDGVAVACVLVADEDPETGDGLAQQEATLYARAVDFAKEPAVRQRLEVGGRPWNVTRVDEEQGMLVIRLQWNNS